MCWRYNFRDIFYMDYRHIIRSKNFAFFVAVLGSFMSALDASVVNIALPSISRFFSSPITHVQWVIIVYGLGIVSLLPLGSKLGNKYGQNKIYALGFTLFGLGSLFCGLSTSLFFLVLLRIIQAAGAAMMFALSQSIVVSIFTGVKRGQFLGIIGSAVALGSITGPGLGGLLLDTFGWQAIFYINLPVAAFGAYYALQSLPSITRKRLGNINFTEFFYFIAACMSFIIALSLAQSAGLHSPRILLMLAAAVGFITLLLMHERKSANPLLNLHLYKNKVFATGNGAMFIVFICTAINGVLIPFYLQDIYGLSALKTGLLVLFYSIAVAVTAPVSGRLSGKIGSRTLAVSGNLLTVAGFVWYMNLGTTYHEYQIILGQIILGVANGMFQSPNNNSIMSSVQKRFYNDAGALNSLSRNLGIVTGVAFTVNLFDAFNARFLAEGLAHNAAFSKAYHATLGAGVFIMLCAAALSWWGKPAGAPAKPEMYHKPADLGI